MGMPVNEADWVALEPPAKRERLLSAAADVFAREGLDASMPTIAAAAGAGVASVYRQFPSKQDLLAELVVQRLDQIAAAAEGAAAEPGRRWAVLTALLRTLVEQQASDPFLGEAIVRVETDTAVRAATGRATDALEKLLAAARAEGRLRRDATTFDLRLLFAATRAARRIEPDAERRMLQLLIDGLRAGAAKGAAE
jgi:AcrR family transcriptional regulator